MVGGERDGGSSGSSRSSRRWRPGRRHAADAGPRAASGTAEEGYLHCGPSGAGHFVKMVHNGIEYGLMQAYAEGFDIFRNADLEGAARGAPLRPRPRRHRRGLAARQRRLARGCST